MEKVKMRQTVNKELEVLMPIGLSKQHQKMWRYLFNVWRQNDLSQANPQGGEVISILCLERIKEQEAKPRGDD